MHYKKIKGPNVYLTPLREEDIVSYTKWMNDPEVTLGINKHHQMTSEKVAKEDLEYFTAGSERYSFGIVFDREDKLIGYGGLFDMDPVHGTATLGLAIGEQEYMNKGFGTEAIALLLHYGFNTLNLHNISLSYHSYNVRAEKAYLKVGFKEMGRRRQAVRLNGMYYDEVLMDLLEEEFRQGPFQNILKQKLVGYEW